MGSYTDLQCSDGETEVFNVDTSACSDLNEVGMGFAKFRCEPENTWVKVKVKYFNDDDCKSLDSTLDLTFPDICDDDGQTIMDDGKTVRKTYSEGGGCSGSPATTTNYPCGETCVPDPDTPGQYIKVKCDCLVGSCLESDGSPSPLRLGA